MDSHIALLGNTLLEGKKVFLTTLSKADLPSIGAWWDDLSRIITSDQKPVTPEEWLTAQQENANYLFGIQTLDGQVLIGACHLSNVMWQARHAQATIKVENPAFTAQGYELDAIGVLLRYAFMDVNLNRVYARICSGEESTIAAFEQAGMCIEGRQRQSEYRDNSYLDTVVMGILQREWMEQEDR